MSDFERQRPDDSPQNKYLPTLEKARADKDKFFELIKEVEESATAHAIDPQTRTLAAAGEEYVANILQHAGKIPENDPRHEIFECYNAILDKWNELIRLRKVE